MSETDQERASFRNPVKGGGWAQLYHAITCDPDISDGAYRLYALYLRYAQQSDSCFPSRKLLADLLNTSEATITRRNSELESAGYITRERQHGNGGRRWISTTWIEDVEQHPRLLRIASEIATPRIKNEPNLGSKMSRTSDQKCAHEEEELKKIMGAHAPQGDATASDPDRVYEMEYIEDDLSGDCPACGEAVIYANLRRARAECPSCGVSLRVKAQDGRVICKPPQQKRDRDQHTLGTLLTDCPDRLGKIPYYARDRARLLMLWKEHGDVLGQALNTIMDYYALGKASWNKIASQALETAARRIEASREDARRSGAAEAADHVKSTRDRMLESGYTEEQLIAMGIA